MRFLSILLAFLLLPSPLFARRSPDIETCTAEGLYLSYQEAKAGGEDLAELGSKLWWSGCPSAIRSEVYERIVNESAGELSVFSFTQSVLNRIGRLQRKYGSSSRTACGRMAIERTHVQARRDDAGEPENISRLVEVLGLIDTDFSNFCIAKGTSPTSCPHHAHRSRRNPTICECDPTYNLNETRTSCIKETSEIETWMNKYRQRPARRYLRRQARLRR